MLIVPIQAVANQVVSVLLAGQQCQVSVYQRSTGLFLDLAVSAAPIVYGVICQDRNPIVRDAYLGFVGDLAFFDVQGTYDPTFDGLGVRYFLGYYDITELPAGVA
jgi:hypothetical protein